MGNLLCALTGFLVPLVLLGLALRRGFRPMAAASAYRNVAWRLGLEADTRGTSMHGYLERRRLFVGNEPAVRGRGPGVRAVLELAEPLGLGLLARRRVRGRIARLRRVRDVVLGDPSLDARLRIGAFEPEAARALFTDGVRDALVALLDQTATLELTDHWVQVTLARPLGRAEQLTRLVDALEAVARAVEAARPLVPVPHGLAELIPAWSGLAASLHLSVEPSRPAITGSWRGHEVLVVPVRQAEGWAADVRVWLPEHRPTGLSITPQADSSAALPSRQDIEVGDPAFDEAFVIQGFDPRVIRDVVRPEARDALLALLERASVRVSDVALEIRGAPTEEATLAPVLRLALQAAASLAWPVSIGPSAVR